MKFGTHCYLFVDRWSDETLWVLEQSKELGLECVEIAVGDDVNFSSTRTADLAASLGLELIVSPGGTWPVEADLSLDELTKQQRALAWHKKQIDLANALNAIAYCGALYGHPGTVKKEPADPAEYPRIAEGLNELAEYGACKGIAVVLEPMSHFRTHVVNTPTQAMRLIDLADHPNLYVLLDTYHLATEITDFAAAIHTVAERLWGLHACENNRGVPGRGLLPWQEIFSSLKECSFDGYVLMETYNSSLGDFAPTRGMFHDVCPDGAAFIKAGLAFLKQGFVD